MESKVKSEIRELGSNSNNIMGDKLCLQLCGFQLVCCIIEKSEHSKHQNFLCICFIARFSIFGIYPFFNKLFQSWVNCHILFTIYDLALISKWTKNTALWNTINNPFKIFDFVLRLANCMDGKLFKASLSFLLHFSKLCHNICLL